VKRHSVYFAFLFYISRNKDKDGKLLSCVTNIQNQVSIFMLLAYWRVKNSHSTWTSISNFISPQNNIKLNNACWRGRVLYGRVRWNG